MYRGTVVSSHHSLMTMYVCPSVVDVLLTTRLLLVVLRTNCRVVVDEVSRSIGGRGNYVQPIIIPFFCVFIIQQCLFSDGSTLKFHTTKKVYILHDNFNLTALQPCIYYLLQQFVVSSPPCHRPEEGFLFSLRSPKTLTPPAVLAFDFLDF